jgi:hypothetical protein
LQGDSTGLVLNEWILVSKILPGAPSPTMNFSYCVYSTIPNNACDSYIADDGKCETFTANVPIGLLEFKNEMDEIHTYPNPFTLNLVVESITVIEKITLSDQTGRIIFCKSNVTKNMELELKEIESGIYFLKIETEKGSQIKKVIKN